MRGQHVVTLIQRAVFPDAAINAERSLFYHATGAMECDQTGCVRLDDGTTFTLDGYYNVLPGQLYDWDGRSLAFTLRGVGRVRAEIRRLAVDGSSRPVATAELVLDPKLPALLPVEETPDGLMFAVLTALGPVQACDLAFVIAGRAPRVAFIAGCITTFAREAALADTLGRLDRYIAVNPDLRDRFRLLVIDNGSTLAPLPLAWATLVHNPNWGGSGGFARALHALSGDPGVTHALFMDDDARFFPDAIRRTWAILAYGIDPDLAISGALIVAQDPAVMFENGACFRDVPVRRDAGMDLSSRQSVAALSHGASTPGDHRYGAWWFFCFPLAQARIWPFPFFVRGDDIHFSLANRFRIANPVGIAAVQDSFDHRQTPLSVYLDTRQQVLQMLMFFQGDAAHHTIAQSIRANFRRYNAAYHYGTAGAIIQALADVAQGPSFWDANLGLERRRRELRHRAACEYPAPDCPAADETAPIRLPFGLTWLARRLTYDGHILPRWSLRRSDACTSLDRRGDRHAAFGHRALVTRDVQTGMGTICRMDRARYFANRRGFARVSRALLARLDTLATEYREAQDALASPAAWARRFAQLTVAAPAPVVAVDAKLERSQPSGVRSYGMALTEILGQAGCEIATVRDAGHVPAGRIALMLQPTRRLVASSGAAADLTAAGLFRLAQSRFHRLGRMTAVHAGSPPDLAWWTYPLPLRLAGVPNIYTVHDLIPLADPGNSPVSAPRLLRLLRLIEASANHVVTVSHASRDDLLARLGWDPGFVSVLYQSSALTTPETIDAAGRNDPAAPLVCVGSVEPRKNIARLLAAYRASGTARPLMLCGAAGWHSAQIMREIEQTPGASWTGVLSDRDLEALLARARALIFPSLAEGFGRPLVEAMQFGLPIIASGLAPSREVAGDCALFFPPHDTGALAEAIVRIDTDDDLVRDLGTRARARFASTFDRDVLAGEYRRFVARFAAARG
ncbi:glycosyltransferase [Novosphingobium sp.]|uniref:glycosyltransferase n=1 Tax=Novosphingobium sp. TaxID=1874826 RepID=UPI003B519D6F